MSKRGKQSARLVVRRLGGVRVLKKYLADQSNTESREFVTKLLARYEASEKRRKKRAAHRELLHGARFSGPATPPPPPT